MNYQLFGPTMLRGLGVTMSLPRLESLRVSGDDAPNGERAGEAPTRVRTLNLNNDHGTLRFPHLGVHLDKFGDTTEPLDEV